MNANHLPEILSEDRVASLLGLSLKGFRNYRRSGDGPAYVQLGRGVVYRREDVEEWLLSRRVDPREHGQAEAAKADEAT